MNEEAWKAVVGYEGLYEVSDFGNVRSLDRQVPDSTYGVKNLQGKTLRQQVSTNKYKSVTFSKYGKVSVKTVHRLVALSFLPVAFPDTLQVNHKNLDKLDNRLVNLEWCTNLENRQHATQAGKHCGLLNPNYQLRHTVEKVLEVKTLLATTTLTQLQIGQKTGMSEDMVGSILRGESWQLPGQSVKISRPKTVRRTSPVPLNIELAIRPKILTCTTAELVKTYEVNPGYVYRLRATVRKEAL
jgi:hypothetical protein